MKLKQLAILSMSLFFAQAILAQGTKILVYKNLNESVHLVIYPSQIACRKNFAIHVEFPNGLHSSTEWLMWTLNYKDCNQVLKKMQMSTPIGFDCTRSSEFLSICQSGASSQIICEHTVLEPMSEIYDIDIVVDVSDVKLIKSAKSPSLTDGIVIEKRAGQSAGQSNTADVNELIRKASLLKDSGQDSMAVVMLQEAVKLDTAFAKDGYNEIGAIYFKAKRYENAAEAYKRRIELLKEAAESIDYYYYGQALYFSKEFQKSIDAFAIASKDYLDADFWRARCSFKLDNAEAPTGLANTYFASFLFRIHEESLTNPIILESSKKNLIETYSYFGFYFLTTENYECSKASWLKVQELDPSNEKAKAALLYSLINKASGSCDIISEVISSSEINGISVDSIFLTSLNIRVPLYSSPDLKSKKGNLPSYSKLKFLDYVPESKSNGFFKVQYRNDTIYIHRSHVIYDAYYYKCLLE
jgi:tetratricopeptide (TPR) repeat protein